MLNSRGRVVEDLILHRQSDDKILIESDRNNQPKLRKLLEMYKMHKDVAIEKTDYSVYHADGDAGIAGFPDPRLSEGVHAHEEAYEERRFDFGIPEGPNELAGELPLFVNADIMNGIRKFHHMWGHEKFVLSLPRGLTVREIGHVKLRFSADKGCYLGQELTARALSAPEVRKRLLPFTCSGAVSGKLVSSEGRREGKIVACNGRKGLAMVPYSPDFIQKQFRTEEDEIDVFLPSWWPGTFASQKQEAE
ncbi:unnamed protein product [Gongylonema pulchrum]|uniref:GCV_T domain-containing protein n=1 Tax=Gongylonema pulchrum TaxID=637853 RepID=A0A183DXH5_9BILA|nr:unnamed protein product [Gongylonema pulchrum]